MKNLTVDFFDRIEMIPKLLKYFALSPDNKVKTEGVFEGIYITYYQDDDGRFHKVVENAKLNDEPYDLRLNEMDLNTLYAIISQLDSLPASMEGTYFKTMEDQVNGMSCAYVDPRVMERIRKGE